MAMCNWRTRITVREHIVPKAVRLGRGKGIIPYLFMFAGGDKRGIN
jgi:hypothetical protein